jgi:hypothetical protein
LNVERNENMLNDLRDIAKWYVEMNVLFLHRLSVLLG